MTDVGAFHNNDAGIITQFPGQLSITNIDSVDTLCSTPQQALCKAARRGSHIDSDQASRIELKGIEGFFEFDTAPADIFEFRCSFSHMAIRIKLYEGPRFIHQLTPYIYLTRHDNGTCSFSASGQSPPYQSHI